jgi:hypothetical protein
MFLRRVPHRSVRRRRIRQWLLLGLRCAALALLALAFAQPVLERANPLRAASGGATARVVLIDRSYSMGYQDRWPRALAAARDVLGEARPGDKTGVVFFGATAEAGHSAHRRPCRARGGHRRSEARLGWDAASLPR